MRLAVVTSRTFDSWDERAAVVSRLVGALGCIGDVDLLVAAGNAQGCAADGAAARWEFPAEPPDPVRRHAVELLMFGPRRHRDDCGCLEHARAGLAASGEPALERELIRLRGGASPALSAHLADSAYDAVVFIGAAVASTVEGIEQVAGRTPSIVMPLARHDPALGLPTVRATLERADAVGVTTEHERTTVLRHAPNARVDAIGCVLRVHDLALNNEPLRFEPKPTVVVAGNWAVAPPDADLVLSVRRLNRDLEGAVVVRLIGPGWEGLPDDVRAPHADSRLDVWRWVVRSLAVWEPDGDRILGRDVIEAMQYGSPVVTAATGAAREHADLGNGGLWYRSYEELRGAIELLRDDEDMRKVLGQQGAAYGRSAFGDTDAYVERVRALVRAAQR